MFDEAQPATVKVFVTIERVAKGFDRPKLSTTDQATHDEIERTIALATRYYRALCDQLCVEPNATVPVGTRVSVTDMDREREREGEGR